MVKPLVSIFLPYYNDEKFLKDAIEGVLNQTYQNWELFLFNHASTDNSRRIAHSFNDSRIKHIDSNKNLGAGSGYNLKITLPLMKGKYIKLLCADDVLQNDAINILVETLENNPDKDIVFADMDYVDEQLDSLNTTWMKEKAKADLSGDEKTILLKIFQGWSHIAYPAAMIKTDALKSIKLDITMIMLFDVSLWIKLLIAGKKIIFLNRSVIDYRISSKQLSSIYGARIASKRGWFELSQLLNLYYEIKDIDLIKYLCPCDYSEQLKHGDEKYIPFVLSYYFASITQRNDVDYFKDQVPVRELFGNTKLWELMQDEQLRIDIENKFGFGIKEFRDVYSYLPSKEKRREKLKIRIYNKQAKNLSLLQIIYLLVRKIGNYISPTYYVHKIKKNINKKVKKYTV